MVYVLKNSYFRAKLVIFRNCVSFDRKRYQQTFKTKMGFAQSVSLQIVLSTETSITETDSFVQILIHVGVRDPDDAEH